MNFPDLPTLILVDIPAGQKDALNPELSDVFGQSMVQRIPPGFASIRSNMSPDAARNALAECELRWAVGARDIWQLFPEYRGNFIGNIERYRDGQKVRVSASLRDTVLGDRLLDKRLVLFNQPIYSGVPNPAFTTKEILDDIELDLGNFGYLEDYYPPSDFSIDGLSLYFCDHFSIVGAEPVQIAPTVQFISATGLIESTEFVQRLASINVGPYRVSSSQPTIPTQFSGAFLIREDQQNPDFGQAVMGRIMAAAALSNGVAGVQLHSVRVSGTSIGAQWTNDENDFRPFASPNPGLLKTITATDLILQSVISLLQKTTPESYRATKDDFRLLCLDTAEDIRRSTAFPTQYAQLWMALERLLPFHGETTAQLALALSAYESAENRYQHFLTTKADYALRSRIVHGYSFKRDGSLHKAAERLPPLFRKLFATALSVESPNELRELLMTHVLSGTPTAIGV